MPLHDKIISPDAGATICQHLTSMGKPVVFTNGCFDILHPGHVQYLEAAKALGACLMLGLNSDASVKRLNKGPNRPVNPWHARATVLAALQSVDYVMPFEEDTPLELIMHVKPVVLCKGGDYTPEAVVGAAAVTSWGGRVEIIPFVKGFSTSALIQKLNAL
ncbi:MAG: D-glycero-beta-D-manno-heptose 1-phosphate adenylyltransferase [Bacteroidia bacterium]|jgi:D-beta-D-heptose 7-phosphate kinase/D-beta-D-heptose 1-phosphate adenosyltransferase